MRLLLKTLLLTSLIGLATLFPTRAFAASADLTVSYFALTDSAGNVKSTFAPNESIYVRYIIKNVGTAPATNKYTSSGNIWSQIYGNKPSFVAVDTPSDVGIWTRNANNIAPNASLTYASYPSGTHEVAFEGANSWKKSSPGTYVARAYVNYDNLANESTLSNNQRTVTYTISSAATPTPTKVPTPTPTKVVTPTPTKTISPTPTNSPVTPTPTPVPAKGTASCEDGAFILTLGSLPTGVRGWNIRVDDTRNGWTGYTQQQGDSIIDNFTGSVYQRGATPGFPYNWWYHTVLSDGTQQAPTGGTIHCLLLAPRNLTVYKEGSTLKFAWAKGPGDVRYALRIDDMVNGWGGDSPLTGDVVNNNAQPFFSVTGIAGHKYTWWVHAIDSYGVYSRGTVATYQN